MEAVIATCREISGAVTHLHGRRLLHGDLTANNVLLTCKSKNRRGFVAKVADFGLSRVLTEGLQNVQTQSEPLLSLSLLGAPACRACCPTAAAWLADSTSPSLNSQLSARSASCRPSCWWRASCPPRPTSIRLGC